jgi:hypothetical protein
LDCGHPGAGTLAVGIRLDPLLATVAVQSGLEMRAITQTKAPLSPRATYLSKCMKNRCGDEPTYAFERKRKCVFGRWSTNEKNVLGIGSAMIEMHFIEAIVTHNTLN